MSKQNIFSMSHDLEVHSFIIYIAPIHSRPNFSEALPNPDGTGIDR